MLGSITSLFRGHNNLPEVERRLYKAEKEENFRWISQLCAQCAPEPLKCSDIVDSSLQTELSEIGQFAELAHGSMSPTFIWQYLTQLSEPDYPLHHYGALSGSILLSELHGGVANLQGYIAYRPEIQQLVVAFSGTSSSAQAIQALSIKTVPCPRGSKRRVHSGFWNMYSGIRADAISKLKEALRKCNTREIVITGHSMGAVIGSFFCLDLLEEQASQEVGRDVSFPQKVKITGFGAPRIGNLAFAQHWREVIDSFGATEYSIRIYNDGVPTLPPYFAGYRHLSANPLYFAHGRLWRISPEQSEYSSFKFDPKAIENADNTFSLGGHNYFNGRDMELLQRRIKWFEPHPGDTGDTWDILNARFLAGTKGELAAGS